MVDTLGLSGIVTLVNKKRSKRCFIQINVRRAFAGLLKQEYGKSLFVNKVKVKTSELLLTGRWPGCRL